MRYMEWLRRPAVVFASIALGAATGLYFKQAAHMIAPLGDVYLTFLKMLVIPIMATAVITSLGRLFASHEASPYIKRLLIVFVAGLTITTFIGIGFGLAGSPGGSIDQASREILGKTILSQENAVSQDSAAAAGIDPYQFLFLLIPSNIFQALQGGQNLQILFVSVVFGIAVGTLKSEQRNDVISIIEVTYKAFEKMMSWTLYGLPLGLLCIIAGEFSKVGLDLLYSMATYIVLVYGASLLLMAGSSLLIARMQRQSFFGTMKDLKEPMLIAFGTRNSMATIPSVFEVLKGKYRVSGEAASLVVPLSIVVCRYSMVVVFSIGAIFVAELYGKPLGLYQIMLIAIGTLIATAAGSGAPIIASLSMISLVLGPLGLPSQTAVVLLLSVIPIIDPVLTMLNVHMACSTTMLVDSSPKRSVSRQSA